MILQIITEQVIEAAKAAGKFALKERTNFLMNKVEVKGEHNFVSYVDKACEQMLVDALSKVVPTAGFIAEEGTGTPIDGGLNWVIDPLDGTTNYIHGLAPYAVSVALLDGNKVLVGVVYEPNLDECFWANAESAAYCNADIIKVSDVPKVNDSLVCTGFPYYDYTRIDQLLKSLDYFMRHSHGMRRLGSAATDLVYVACGRFDAFYEYGLNPWDVAAGALIVERAGGKVCDYSKGNNYIFGAEIIATNSSIHDEFVDVVNGFMISK